ncbi:MAG: hypothetical protein QF898_08455 [SAR202 cluster bacterium]|jgi:hypothetical protein|nr:hypothetical protein [SAR202 cluster bacterium]MDP6512816.1 hypothetical protein [SAR202 cluster bacterium]MDP6716712.1 hypothetical protein [SAR202 cluster bacterium]
MSNQEGTCLPTTTWYLFDEEDQPLGQIYRPGFPDDGLEFEGGQRFESGEVVSFSELRATCSMRRFRVIVRVLS